jgi:putative ABC transport system ATP-binding protein
MLSIANLSKRHPHAARPVFSGLGLAVAAGEIVALIGESGVGKSTLLNCIAGLESGRCRRHPDRPAGGATSCASTKRRAPRCVPRPSASSSRPSMSCPRSPWRRTSPCRCCFPASPPAQHAPRIESLLARVGLAGFGPRWPGTLSGGELQRVAIARALVHRPALILADEPTGNLDPRTADEILTLLLERVREEGASALIVTHSQHVAQSCDRILTLTPDGLQ